MNKIKFARLDAGYTHTELCRIVKTSPKRLVEIERGNTDNVSKILMIRLSQALKTPIKELFFDDIKEFDEEEVQKN